MKNLIVGFFYSLLKHPAYLYSADDKKNEYLAIKTGTTERRHSTRLKHPTEKKVKESYVDNRPYLGKRKNFGSKILQDMKINEEDMNTINEIAKKPPHKIKSK